MKLDKSSCSYENYRFIFDDAPLRATRNTLSELTEAGTRVPLVKGERNVREAPTSSMSVASRFEPIYSQKIEATPLLVRWPERKRTQNFRRVIW